jgi:cellulose synthase/poly-beta-1,6-N-acetylglucosamine synthase-like glycosyltransferase
MILESVFAVLVFIHTIPLLGYIVYMRHVALNRPWNIGTDSQYTPEISVLIPVLNEASTIEKKLNNILEMDYPREKTEIVIADNGSTDATLEIAKRWSETNRVPRTRIVVEKTRGMVHAENAGLKIVTKPIIAKTDADCLWKPDSVRRLVSFLVDDSVASVAATHQILAKKMTSAYDAELTYRGLYKWLRIGESKLGSTVIFEGELMLIKTQILRSVGGFDTDIGCDDVPLALKLLAHGYRAVSVENAYFIELTPFTWSSRFQQKVRRGRHVLQSLWKYKYLARSAQPRIRRLPVVSEFYIYLLNPLIFVCLIPVLLLVLVRYPIMIALTLLILVPRIRKLVMAHLSNMLIMLDAIFRESLRRAPLPWTKIDEIR